MNASRSPCSVMPCFGRSGSSLAEYCLLMLRGTLACRYCAEVPALSVKHRFRQVRPYPSGTPGRNSGIAGLQPLPRFSVPLLTLLAKSTIRPEDARNPVKHLGSKRRFLPSVAVQIATSEFANSVRCYSAPLYRQQRLGRASRRRPTEGLRLPVKKGCREPASLR